jgi:hypothetical protein
MTQRAEVETVGGRIATGDLGVTLMHEHVFVLSPEIMANYPEGWGDEQAREDSAVDKLNALKAIGVDTIVDPTVIGLGRYIPRILRVAARTDLAALFPGFRPVAWRSEADAVDAEAADVTVPVPVSAAAPFWAAPSAYDQPGGSEPLNVLPEMAVWSAPPPVRSASSSPSAPTVA